MGTFQPFLRAHTQRDFWGYDPVVSPWLIAGMSLSCDTWLPSGVKPSGTLVLQTPEHLGGEGAPRIKPGRGRQVQTHRCPQGSMGEMGQQGLGKQHLAPSGDLPAAVLSLPGLPTQPHLTARPRCRQGRRALRRTSTWLGQHMRQKR